MGRIYLKPVDFITDEKFDVWVPAYYDPTRPPEMIATKPKPFEKTNRFRLVSKSRRSNEPFYKPYAEDQPQLMSMSIEDMLKMHYRKVNFELVKEPDIVEIFEGLDRYLISLKVDVEMGSERIIEYVKLCLDWRKEVYKHYYRYMELNPAAKEKLYPNSDPTKNIFHIMTLVSGLNEETYKLDPLKARRDPPYEVEAIKPKEELPSADAIIESSYGLSTESPILDDGKDFDFENFIGKDFFKRQ